MTSITRIANQTLRVLSLCAGLFAASTQAFAHKASDAYFISNQQTIQFSVALKDLDATLESLDANNDRNLTWAEVRAALPQIIQLVDDGVHVKCADKLLSIGWQFESLEQRSDGAYVRLGAAQNCALTMPLTLTYELFAKEDQSHRLIVSGTQNDLPIAGLMIPGATTALSLRLGETPASGIATALQFFPSGVHHILTGYDHLAFLLALLLPISIAMRPSHSVAAGSTVKDRVQSQQRSNLWRLVRTVTGFTIGHSLTLVLANLGYFSAPSSIVEPLIAVTIIATAVLNLYPQRWMRTDVLALVFGLVHGLGFSGVMAEAGINGGLLLWGLAGFNLGVEAGQLLVVASWCVLQRLAFRDQMRHARLLRYGSWLLIAVGLMWLVQRV